RPPAPTPALASLFARPADFVPTPTGYPVPPAIEQADARPASWLARAPRPRPPVASECRYLPIPWPPVPNNGYRSTDRPNPLSPAGARPTRQIRLATDGFSSDRAGIQTDGGQM